MINRFYVLVKKIFDISIYKTFLVSLDKIKFIVQIFFVGKLKKKTENIFLRMNFSRFTLEKYVSDYCNIKTNTGLYIFLFSLSFSFSVSLFALYFFSLSFFLLYLFIFHFASSFIFFLSYLFIYLFLLPSNVNVTVYRLS